MSDWLDNFGNGQLYVTEGEKILMRFAMDKERQRIIKLLEEEFNDTWPTGVAFVETSLPNLIELIKGEN